MANTVFTYGKSAILGTASLAVDTIKAALLMTDNNAAATEDATFLSGLTLDECDGSNYARVTLANCTVSAVTASNLGKFDCDDFTFPTVGAGTRNISGILIYKHVGADSANIPLFYIDTPAAGLPLTASGADIVVAVHANGVATLG
jgi:hypothetical protein